MNKSILILKKKVFMCEDACVLDHNDQTPSEANFLSKYYIAKIHL